MAQLNATGLKILITDGSQDDRRHLAQVLMQAEVSVACTEAENLNGAYLLCHKHTFDCALLECCLPGEDCLEGIAVLHEQYPYMAIVVATNQGDDLIAAQAIKQGALDYLRKATITPESICGCVRGAVEKARLLQRAERQRLQLENFSRVLVHDLKAPLQTVQSFATLIEQSFQAGEVEDLLEYCRRAKNTSTRALALIEALHLYTKAEEQVLFEPVDMRQVMSDTLINLNHAIGTCGASITYDDLPVVSGNAPLLTQMLQNLISNGMKFSNATTPKVHVEAQALNNDGWLFAVKDNGIGIPDIYRNEIFEPFKRLHGVSEYEGSGLGLATCKRVVERHKGKIWSESQEGHGTTLFFTLPGA